MASPDVLNIAELTAPLPGGDAGDYRHSKELISDFKSMVAEKWFPTGDPRRDEPRKDRWPEVADLARKALREQAKDVRLAAWLTVACMRAEGFAGLRDGLRLLNVLVAQCWDRILPAFDTRSPGVRGECIATVLDGDSELRVPGMVRMLPIVRGERASYGSYHLNARDGDGAVADKEDLERARQALTLPDCRRLAEDIAQALGQLDGLKQALGQAVAAAVKKAQEEAAAKARAEAAARGLDAAAATAQAEAARQALDKHRTGPPAFEELRNALLTCQADVKALQDKLEPPPPPAGEPVPGVVHAVNGAAGIRVDTNNVAAARDRVYQQLEDAARSLEVLQPGTAFPDVIRKVVRWSRLSYRELHEAKIHEVLTKVVTHTDGPEKK